MTSNFKLKNLPVINKLKKEFLVISGILATIALILGNLEQIITFSSKYFLNRECGLAINAIFIDETRCHWEISRAPAVRPGSAFGPAEDEMIREELLYDKDIFWIDSSDTLQIDNYPVLDIRIKNLTKKLSYLHSLKVQIVWSGSVWTTGGGQHIEPTTNTPLNMQVPLIGTKISPISEAIQPNDIGRLIIAVDPGDFFEGKYFPSIRIFNVGILHDENKEFKLGSFGVFYPPANGSIGWTDFYRWVDKNKESAKQLYEQENLFLHAGSFERILDDISRRKSEDSMFTK